MLELSYIFLIGILLTVMLEAKALWPTTKILTHFHPLLTVVPVYLDGENLNAVKLLEVAEAYFTFDHKVQQKIAVQIIILFSK